MRRILTLVLTTFLPLAIGPATAQDSAGPALIRPAGDSELGDFLWKNRVIVVFADSDADPRFEEQIALLRDGQEMLADRDVVVLTDTDPAARMPVRQKLRPRGFQMALVDKDGVVKLRKPSPWSVREITRSIDKTQQRMHEVEDRRQKALDAVRQ